MLKSISCTLADVCSFFVISLDFYVFFLTSEFAKNKNHKPKNHCMVKIDSKKRKFPFSLRKKEKKKATQSDVALHVSAARVSKTPQLDHRDLSYAGQHLILLLQHQIDANKIKVPADQVSWKDLVELNQDVDLLEKKKRAKEFCGIHHFSPNELQEIAERVTKFVKDMQPKLVVKA